MAKKQRLSIVSQQAKRNSQVPYFARGSGDVQEGTGESFHASVVHCHEPPKDVTAADRELVEALDRELWDYSGDEVKEDIDVDQKEEEEEVPKKEEEEEVPEMTRTKTSKISGSMISGTIRRIQRQTPTCMLWRVGSEV